jgi:hypothetical protein
MRNRLHNMWAKEFDGLAIARGEIASLAIHADAQHRVCVGPDEKSELSVDSKRAVHLVVKSESFKIPRADHVADPQSLALLCAPKVVHERMLGHVRLVRFSELIQRHRGRHPCRSESVSCHVPIPDHACIAGNKRGQAARDPGHELLHINGGVKLADPVKKS